MKKFIKKLRICFLILIGKEYLITLRTNKRLYTITSCGRDMFEMAFTFTLQEMEEMIEQDIAVESVNEIINQK